MTLVDAAAAGVQTPWSARVPRVSVVIPTFNQAAYVTDAIASVLAQTLPPYEIIVVDDGSTDDTQMVLKQYEGRIRVVVQDNRGVSLARNVGVRHASGELLAFLDADDIWLPRKLEKQVKRYVADPQLGLVSCGREEVDTKGSVLRRNMHGRDGWVASDMLLFRPSVICGSAMFLPRTVFSAVGGFDPELPPSEDWDLCYRVARQYRVAFIPETLVRYRIHGANAHLDIERVERGMLSAWKKTFATADPEAGRLRRQSYGKLHLVLAACSFTAGRWGSSLRHLLKSLYLTPTNCAYVLGFPARRARRLLEQLRDAHGRDGRGPAH